MEVVSQCPIATIGLLNVEDWLGCDFVESGVKGYPACQEDCIGDARRQKGGSKLLIKKPMAKINRCLLPDN